MTALVAAALPAHSLAAGGDSFFVDLAGAVAGNCRIVGSGPYSLTLTLDPGAAGDVTASMNSIRFWCTKGVGFTLADDGGLRGTHQLAGPDPAPIPYQMTFTPSQTTGTGPASPITLTVNVIVAYGDFSNKFVGTYTDRVTVSINP